MDILPSNMIWVLGGTLAAVIALGLVRLMWARVGGKSAGVSIEPFLSRRLINAEEQKLLYVLGEVAPQHLHLFAQVSYGEFLKCKDNRKYRTMNAKRADFVLCDDTFNVVAVIEYQGGGHFGGSFLSARKAKASDAAKRQALAEAGIPMIEVPEKFDAASVSKLIEKAAEEEFPPLDTRSAFA